ncbi:c-type cytochrome [Phragmitibacter flavus]|uniref:C-type cytochrome n=1 Tax=Phragmitibacter flavus TaxID=2576071 RepID=A0A5R8KEX1_9BACT|nr:PVC-type heme-binding CxxCH protein [Phragmitibacter flavus]TLD70853.1 c-type cytochrome [Phragmitibacter flavus]
MKHIVLALALFASTALAPAADWLHLPAKQGTANGKKIVLVAGDEEYRSEETAPMLAKILSQKHGFDCTVLFSINPDGGYIDSNFQTNTPGTEALNDADLLIIGTRFRQLPEAQLAPFAKFLNDGKPVIGFRTATHAFKGDAKTGDFKWADFGFSILGERWVNHHGVHKKEGTRSVIEAANKSHEILKSVGEIFGATDVYGIKNLDEKAATILLRGAVTESLNPKSKNLDGPKNKPMMPLAWLREYTAPNGTTKGKAFCTTLGSSDDFADEDLRRLVINASLYLTGQKVPDKSDATPVDKFEPTFYGNLKNEFYKNLNRKPADYALGKSPATGGVERPKYPDNSGPGAPHAPQVEPTAATSVRPQAVAAPSQAERIVLIGNGLAERDVYYHRIETELHLRFPDQQLFLRNMGRVGDTPGFRPHPSRPTQWAFPGAEKFHPELKTHNGKGFFPTPDQWLTHLKADTIVAFFGYNESFDGPSKVANFEAELDAWVQHSLTKAYNGKAAPRIVLVSPIAFEDQSAQRDLPNGQKENANIILYSATIETVAKKHGLTFIDLFTPTKTLYANTEAPLTTDGFVPNELGYEKIAELLATGIYGHQSRTSKADPALVREAVKEKDWFWNNDYHILNGVHTHGQRYNPFGPQNYPDEVKKTREMAALRDTLIHNVASSKKSDLSVDDSKTHQLPDVPTNYQPSAKNGTQEYLYGEAAEKSLTVPEGYKVELFASEKEFPNLANPMQLSFDAKGRLWVATMPTYPHYRPGDAMPDDKILIYEDTNGDGKADKETVFADKLHLPIGFEFAADGVYVSQEPNLVLIRDTNGDDKADSTEIVLGGFDTHDTHHAISAFTADPSGGIIMCEGVFLHSNVETAYGPIRAVDGGFYRYSPQRSQLERTVQMGIPNPWGAVFDQWGQDFFLHTSGTSMNWMLPVSIKPTFGSKTPSTPDLIPEGQKVRPTSGLEIVSSRHFPDEVQGDIILANSIGFLGIKQHQIEDNGTGWKTTFRHDLLKSTDGNFRPVDLEFAPDGSLYVIDWHNVLIGHMQHNARDPLRDHVHGRIYRITYPSRPLVKPAQVAGASIETLLNNLKEPELRARYRTRNELRGRPAAEVLPALKTWVAALDKNDAKYEHHLLEALWTTWGLNQVDPALLNQVFAAKDARARAAAVRVIRYNFDRIPDAVALLEKAANDENGRVRLEATVAASWLPDIAAAKKIVAITSSKPLDEWSTNANKTAETRLSGLVEKEVSDHVELAAPAHLDAEAKAQFLAGQKIYFREGHCVTCHQPNGKGLDPAFPSIEKSPWVTEDADRLIKLTMYGLMGPLEVNGKKYDGQVPMTPFAGMLNDQDIADVLTFVRNSFGNKADPIKPSQVKPIRDANPGRMMFYTTDQLLKEHPFAK